jgi:xanthine dehydrogenase small subunit
VDEVDVPGPPTSVAIRGAGWVEAAVLVAAATGAPSITAPGGATAAATVTGDGAIEITVACGDPLDEVVLRSYCIGAAHMAIGWVTSEAIAVDATGTVGDLTVRSFGVLRAADTPPIELHVTTGPDGGPDEPVRASDAVFAAVALAVWRHQGLPPVWPTGQPLRSRP